MTHIYIYTHIFLIKIIKIKLTRHVDARSRENPPVLSTLVLLRVYRLFID